MRRRRACAVAVLVSLCGCAYFNGLYNANRLAKEARDAERDGRVGEARSLWAQAAIKAESVAVRYPESRHNDDALLLWGQALRSVGRCRDGIAPLETAMRTSESPQMRRRAQLLLGECLVRTDRPDSAIGVLEPLVADTGASWARGAAVWIGRAEMALGAPARAVSAFARADPQDAAFDLARAHQALGNLEAAERVLADRVSGPFDGQQWAAALDTLARASRDAAARLVDRLAARRGLTPGDRARLLIGDGERWSSAGREEPARIRFEAARSTVPDSVEGVIAEVRLAEWDLRGAREHDALRPIMARFEEATRAGGTPGRLADRYLGLLRTAILLHETDSIPQGALRLVLLAEALHDSASADAMAATVLLDVRRRYPESVFAPKALLAAAALDTARAGEARSLLLSEYPDSPYTAVALGGFDARYVVLEDSLRVALAGLRGRAIAPTVLEGSEEELLRRRRP